MKRTDTLVKGKCGTSAIVRVSNSVFDLVYIDRVTDASVHVVKIFDTFKNDWYTLASPRWYRISDVVAVDATMEELRRLVEIVMTKDNEIWRARAQRQAEYDKIKESFAPMFQAIDNNAFKALEALYE